MTEKRQTIIEWLKTIVLALLITFVVKFFLLDLTKISGRSMEDSLQNDDIVLVDRLSSRIGLDYGRGEVLLFDSHDEGKIYIKRIIGLPGERVDLVDGDFYIDGKILTEPHVKDGISAKDTDYDESWVLGEGEYFLLGDNRLNSNDSRNFGPVSKDDFKARAFMRIYPFSKIGKI